MQKIEMKQNHYGGIRLLFILEQELGTVVLTTGITTPGNKLFGLHPEHGRAFEALTVDFHSTTDYLDGCSVEQDSCEFLNGQTCFSDGSGLQAEAIWERVEEEGEESMWEELQEMYERFTGR